MTQTPSPPRSAVSLLGALRLRLERLLGSGSEQSHREAFDSDLSALRRALDPAEPPSSQENALNALNALSALSAQNNLGDTADNRQRAEALQASLSRASLQTDEGLALRQALLHALGAPARLPPPLPDSPFEHARCARLLLAEISCGSALSFNLDACAPLVEILSHHRRLGVMTWPNPAAAALIETAESHAHRP